MRDEQLLIEQTELIERLISLVKKLVIELAQYRTVEEAEKDGRIIEAVQNVSRSDI